VYHRGMNAGTNPEQYVLNLNLNAAQQDDDQFHDTAPTNAVFTLGSNAEVNANNKSYVAYIFAHETGSASMIQCGTYEGNGNATGPVINLGWEPQWLLIKNVDATNNWELVDNMRDFRTPKVNVGLFALNPNSNAVEAEGRAYGATATGFSIVDDHADVNANNNTYIYMAIRRPNMATITDATEVFAIDNGNGSDNPSFVAGFPVDFVLLREIAADDNWQASGRLIQGKHLSPNATATESSNANYNFANNTSWFSSALSSGYYSWMWKRAKGFFDVVSYTGNGTAGNTVAHGLGVAPEMMWVKNRGQTDDWKVYVSGITHLSENGENDDGYDDNPAVLELNTTEHAGFSSSGVWNHTHPTSTVFTLGDTGATNGSGENLVAFLFATLAGVSKVGSVTHSGSSTDVDCGFSAGARFVLLKETIKDTTTGWYIWDSVRGIIGGNDPYIFTNNAVAQVTNTDYIDPLASGFTITGSFTDGNYIFYAIA